MQRTLTSDAVVGPGNTLSIHQKWTMGLGRAWHGYGSLKMFILQVPLFFEELQKHPRETVEQSASAMLNCQRRAIFVAGQHKDKTPGKAAEVIQALISREAASDDRILLGGDELQGVDADNVQYLRNQGLLSYMAHKSSIDYLRSEQAMLDMNEMRDIIRESLEEDASKRKGEEERQAQKRRVDERLASEGLPPADYLEQARGQQITIDAKAIVNSISKAAARTGFQIPMPFEGTTVAEAIKKHIWANHSGDELAGAVRESLRLLGDVMVDLNAFAKANPEKAKKWSAKWEVPMLPIVDAPDSRSPRRQQLDALLRLCFVTDSVGLRGGTLMGYKGFGKSQIVQNLVFGKQLAGWALQDHPYSDRRHHIGIYVKDPSMSTLGLMRVRPPWAHVAVELDRLGLLRDKNGDIPSWAHSEVAMLREGQMNAWMVDRGIDCLIAYDEA